MNKASLSDAECVAQFETFLLCERRVTKNTFDAYKNDINQLVQFLHQHQTSLAACTKKHLQQFLVWLRDNGCGAKSISRKISAIKRFYTYLHERCAMPNKGSTLLFPKLSVELPVYLTVDEVDALLAAAAQDTTPRGKRNNLIVHLLYATGMRASELCAITIDKIQFDTGFINLMGKGNKERMIPLPDATLVLIRAYLDETYQTLLSKSIPTMPTNAFLFSTLVARALKPITRQTVWSIIKSLLKLAGITKEVSPHSLRHSLATHLLTRGADLRSLQLLLGHENLTTVQIYTHVDTKQLRLIYNKKHPRA